MSWYEFRVRGVLDPATLRAFERLTSEPTRAETVLSGDLDDESAMATVLTRIQDLGLELVSLRRLPGDPGGSVHDPEA